MAERKAFSVKFHDYEKQAIDKMAREKGMKMSEYIRDVCLKQNEHIGYNIMEPLCQMRRNIAEAKYLLECGNQETVLNNLINEIERSCDSLWKSVNL